VEAFVSADAFAHLARERALVAGLADLLKVQPDQLNDRVARLIAQVKAAEKEIAALRSRELLADVPALVAAATTVGAYQLVSKHLPDVMADDLRSLAIEVRNAFGPRPGVVALVGGSEKPVLIVATTDAARTLGAKAGVLVSVGALALGGRGGGRDDLAQGGGSDASAAPAALTAISTALAG
jgi:alanyl-tRNA synthetase